MSKIAIEGNASGSGTLTISAPNTNSNFTLSLPTNTGTIITQNSTPAFASTIGVGGATAAASGAGITFPATASASSDANTLDDYEEGTWTPSYSADGGGSSGTPSIASGTYVKIGRMVYIAGSLAATRGTLSGTIQVSGLPFTSRSSPGGNAICIIARRRWDTTFTCGGQVDASSTSFSLVKNASNSSSTVTVNQADMSTSLNSEVQFTGCYEAT
jgi:hypothetical protein